MNTNDEFAKKMAQAMGALPQLIAEEAKEYSRTRFSEKSFDGKPWPALSPKYKPKKGTMLVRSGKLQGSVRIVRVTPKKVVIAAGNSKVPYAQVHNEGFTGSVVVKAHTRKLKKQGKKKKRTVEVKSHTRKMNIPQRQFMGNCPELEHKLKTVSEQFFKSILK